MNKAISTDPLHCSLKTILVLVSFLKGDVTQKVSVTNHNKICMCCYEPQQSCTCCYESQQKLHVLLPTRTNAAQAVTNHKSCMWCFKPRQSCRCCYEPQQTMHALLPTIAKAVCAVINCFFLLNIVLMVFLNCMHSVRLHSTISNYQNKL